MSAPTEAAVVPKIDTLWVLHYKYCEGDVATIRAPYRGEHVALAKSAWEKGDFVMGGALADPIDSALIVFKSKEAAEDFAKRDPYVLNGVVVSHEVREWSTVTFG
mmetsp:Transcript_20565/g.30641  ORF Transcript_20565/g.30641 Transcript_20565/m.30641 type:complete len:105 (+) Transcript_20565:95-409(+)|eukprot:CAMPEP_0194755456 /NCGR_PEP_ID=MMETSP0323_2-20130528/9323_1 /TAXON_ID=2866 ORGANISM="Crypthecodinium cohnii, Strain Seligo" /NCGR_SAMPLE_ID=MMETSP0323_2 /ASSEMBLY_ACC=CAM_ASM_000346 /LENGTH=104 /DNA_ID=CAMNT_0039674507 /DNA_START=82 /DNA_END=396 /DNA_ORIENTATION=+